MAVLILLAYLAIEQRGLFQRGTPGRAAMMQAHFWLGLSVLVFAAWRLALRLRHGAPRSIRHSRCGRWCRRGCCTCCCTRF